MINVGITGGETAAAGELVRLLIYHPDVKLQWIDSDTAYGRVDCFHKGLLGECDMEFNNGQYDLTDTDVVFCGIEPSQHILDYQRGNIDDEDEEPLRIIDLSRTMTTAQGYTYGLCEINRKFMVHNCYHVVLPSPQAMAVLLPLVPLAKNLLLNGDINIELQCGSFTTPISNDELNKELHAVITALQNSFEGKFNITCGSNAHPRELSARLITSCNIDLYTLDELIDQYYDDHNFTFLTSQQVDCHDVINTNKCLLNTSLNTGKVTLTSVIDSPLKGIAGNAVHVMNLLFGLHEKAGLALKAQVLLS